MLVLVRLTNPLVVSTSQRAADKLVTSGDAEPLLVANASPLIVAALEAAMVGSTNTGVYAVPLPTGNKVKLSKVPLAAAVLVANVLANGPTIMLVADGVPTRIPAAVEVPSVNKLVEVVLIKPDVMVNVPLTDKGTLKVKPVALELLIVNEVKLAVVVVIEFLKTPEPEIVCAFTLGIAAFVAKFQPAKFKVAD